MTKTVERTEAAPEYISIREAAERTGLTQRTLRYYEELGLLKPPARVSGGQRLYSPEDIARIKQVRRLKELLNFSLDEIKTVVDAEEAKQHLRADVKAERSLKRKLKQMREAAEITAHQLAMVEEKIAQMQAMKKELARDLAGFNERIQQVQQEIEGRGE
ncbi:MAG: MerR family transcriptional regulator [Chloroflexota bacterium]|nr:MerR family transcriptional regulator [Chloroflexota bacterium]